MYTANESDEAQRRSPQVDGLPEFPDRAEKSVGSKDFTVKMILHSAYYNFIFATHTRLGISG